MKNPPSLLEGVAWLLPLAAAGALAFMIHANRTTDEMRAVARARDDLRTIRSALILSQSLPGTAEGLAALVADGRLPHLPDDPWGRPYQYRYPGASHTYDLFSTGPDGEESADDVVIWNLYGGR